MNQDKQADDLRDAELVTVASCATEINATIFVSALADAGIRAVAMGGWTSSFRAEAPGDVLVQTLECDAERAKEILSELKPSPPELTESDLAESDATAESDPNP